MQLTYASDPAERFFGFGEQFSHFDLKGKKVPILVQEQVTTPALDRILHIILLIVQVLREFSLLFSGSTFNLKCCSNCDVAGNQDP